jgi:anti-sigma regulatory factor (Ser/Thr protein kinase)
MRELVGADDGWGARIRLRSLADLSAMRRRARAELTDAGIAESKVDDTVLVLSELATNAFEAAQPGSAVVVRVRVLRPPGGVARRIEVDVDNIGSPVDDDLTPGQMRGRTSPDGRGLAIAAKLGQVVVEGRIGGSRATYRTPAD